MFFFIMGEYDKNYTFVMCNISIATNLIIIFTTYFTLCRHLSSFFVSISEYQK